MNISKIGVFPDSNAQARCPELARESISRSVLLMSARKRPQIDGLPVSRGSNRVADTLGAWYTRIYQDFLLTSYPAPNTPATGSACTDRRMRRHSRVSKTHRCPWFQLPSLPRRFSPTPFSQW